MLFSICKFILKFICIVYIVIDICCLLIFFYSGNGIFVGVGIVEGDILVYIVWSFAVSVDIK